MCLSGLQGLGRGHEAQQQLTQLLFSSSEEQAMITEHPLARGAWFSPW